MGALLILLIQGLSLAQTRTGALTGRVLSMEGAPVAEIRVAAIDVSEATDGRLLARASIMSIAQTDSAGPYRLENILPGAYYIVADPFESPSYYPGAPALSGGAVITIAAGATIVARDFTLVRSSGIIRTLRTQAQGREGRYTGAITTAWGAPLPNVTIILFHAESDTRFMTVTNEAGAFEFSGLPGGAFSLEVLSAVPSGAAAQGFEQLKASITIEPGQSLRQDIALRMVVGNNNGPPGRPGPAPPTRPDIYVLPPSRSRTPGAAQRLNVATFILEREVIREKAPVYPQSAKDAKSEGSVVLECVFGIDGRVISLRILTRDANPDLARAAVEAVSHWRYAPGSVNGESVEFTGRVTVNFALGN